MKANKIFNCISAFVLLVQAAVEVLFGAVILQLNMLPDRYVIALCAGLVLLLLITAGILFLRGKKPVSLARRIVGWVLVFVVIAGCLIGAKFAKQAYDTLNKVTVTPQDEEEDEFDGICVFVREEDTAQSLEDAAQYTFGIIAEHDEELIAKGEKVTYDEVLSDMNKRDANDSGRKNAPCVPAEDAVFIDNSGYTPEQTFKKALEIINEKIC